MQRLRRLACAADIIAAHGFAQKVGVLRRTISGGKSFFELVRDGSDPEAVAHILVHILQRELDQRKRLDARLAAQWDESAMAYRLSEPTHRFAAIVGSPDVVSHDDTLNYAETVGRSGGLAFTIRPRAPANMTRVVIVGAMGGTDAGAIGQHLLADAEQLEKSAADHYVGVLGEALQVETPDPQVNRARWAGPRSLSSRRGLAILTRVAARWPGMAPRAKRAARSRTGFSRAMGW
jgi:hypothetical protein